MTAAAAAAVLLKTNRIVRTQLFFLCSLRNYSYTYWSFVCATGCDVNNGAMGYQAWRIGSP